MGMKVREPGTNFICVIKFHLHEVSQYVYSGQKFLRDFPTSHFTLHVPTK